MSLTGKFCKVGYFCLTGRLGFFALGASIAVLAVGGVPLAAQGINNAISQPVVQPLPPAELTKLNAALQTLAQNPSNVSALIDAGNASLAVNDIDAAIGFFGRADDLSPNNPRVKLGLAAAFVRTQRPIEALDLFNQAEQAGVSAGSLAMDRGLAYDLVGDNGSAQRHYLQALGGANSVEARRRLALSHAIGGNRKEFEAVLLPLLNAQDFAAYRTRAFGLAILGEEKEAVSITQAVMQRDMASRIEPYLRYMPRLTKAQQAAAGNLGIFPRAAQIGRDTAQIAGYAGTAEGGRNADARLAPQGEPLGPKPDTSSPRRRPDRGVSKVAAAPIVTAPASVSAQANMAKLDTEGSVAPAALVKSEPALVKAEPALVKPELALAEEAPASIAAPPIDAPLAMSGAAVSASAAGAAFDLAAVPQVTQPAPVPPPMVQPAANTRPEPATVAEAFASLALDPGPALRPSGVVDITAIKPPREVAPKPEPKPAIAQKAEPKKPDPKKPEPKKTDHPKRYWVQVATGKDRSALRFDWRRISRKAGGELDGKGPFVTPWGEANRLLAGPYDTERAASTVMSSLKKDDIDSFVFTSPVGQEIQVLK